MITITALPAFSDNYLWLLEHDGHAVVVDPGDAGVVAAALARRALVLDAILITHHHPDHIGGVRALVEQTSARVLGPRAEAAKLPPLDVALDDGDTLTLLAQRIDVLAVPGHTLGHVAYHLPQARALFCGDTLFVGGCGRLFEGTPAQMLASLTRLAALPDDTAVYCAHEYTLSNFAFAQAADPDNRDLQAEFERLAMLREQGLPTVPGEIGRERRYNPFLRVDDAAITASIRAEEGVAGDDPVERLAGLRRWKDRFKPPVR